MYVYTVYGNECRLVIMQLVCSIMPPALVKLCILHSFLDCLSSFVLKTGIGSETSLNCNQAG